VDRAEDFLKCLAITLDLINDESNALDTALGIASDNAEGRTR